MIVTTKALLWPSLQAGRASDLCKGPCRALQVPVQLGLWLAISACASCLGVIEAGLPAAESKGPESDLRTCWVLSESEQLACNVQGVRQA